nr:rRNA maturation RNase YbeY [uncultured Lachnoclostridium sp.]
MTVNIEYETDKELNISYEEIINKVIEEALDYAECPYEAELNVVLTDNESIHQINLETRDIDRPTDVLSFPTLEYDEPGDFSIISEDSYDFNPDTGELMLGDIVISVEKVEEQANAYGHSMERELGFLVAHSMLHLFGYDHMEDDERIVMEKKQEEVLQRCNILRD